MRKSSSSSSHLFLMEIIINIFFFSILLMVSLQIIMKAHALTAQTNELHKAVTCCANAAAVYETGDGSLTSLTDVYSHATDMTDYLLIYLDDNFTSCSKDTSKFTMIVKKTASTNNYTKVSITCYDNDSEIYAITACNYQPLHANTQVGGVQ